MDTNPKVVLADTHQMPLIGLGTLNFKPNDKTFNLNDFIMKAVQVGYTHLDINQNQTQLGDALKLVFEVKRQLEDQEGEKIADQFELAYPREKFFISYKVYNTPEIEKHIKTALQNMKLEYFDLVMLNCPQTPPPEAVPEGEVKEEGEEPKPPSRYSMKKAWGILQLCKEKGLVRSLGVANFSTQALIYLHPFVKHPPVVNQVESHPFHCQKNMLTICKRLNVKLIAYSPLLRGGKDQKAPLGDKVDYMAEPVLKDIAAKYGKSIPQVMLNYQICRGVAVIPKTEKLQHLNDNFNITDFELLEEDVKQVEKLDKCGKVKAYQLKNLPIWKGQDPLA